MSVFEVFRQERKGQPFAHAGSIVAPDAAFADAWAREQFGRRGESEGLWLVPRAMDAAAGVATTDIGPAIGWGLAIVVGLPVLSVVAMATLLGFPLGFGVLLGLALIFAIGQTAGVWVFGRMLIRVGSSAKAFLLGWAIVSAIALVPFLGGLVWEAATVYGLGVLAVAGYRTRRAPLAPAVVPAPPVPLST